MGDVMLYGVLRMPFDMAMGGEIARRQFYSRAQEAARRLEAAEARLAEIDAALASRPAEVDDKRQQDLIDVFDLTWNAAVESAAFYVEGHCADGAHHVEHILELVPPKIVVGGVTVAEVRARRAKADAELWENAMSHAANYVENHCLYGTEHASQIMGMKRPEFGAAPSHTTNKEKD